MLLIFYVKETLKARLDETETALQKEKSENKQLQMQLILAQTERNAANDKMKKLLEEISHYKKVVGAGNDNQTVRSKVLSFYIAYACKQGHSQKNFRGGGQPRRG